MAILHGYINLSKIDKGLITVNKNGEKIIWVDLYTYETPDKYGNVACLNTYDPNTRTKTYLANFKPKELKKEGPQVSTSQVDMGF